LDTHFEYPSTMAASKPFYSDVAGEAEAMGSYVGFYGTKQPHTSKPHKAFANTTKSVLRLCSILDKDGFEGLRHVCRLIGSTRVQSLESAYQLCKLTLNPMFVQLVRDVAEVRNTVRTVFFEGSGAVAFWAMSPKAGPMTLNMNKRNEALHTAMVHFRKLEEDLGLSRGIRWASWTADTTPGSRLHVMRALVRLKMNQHKRLAKLLEATGSARIVERAPKDAFWGDAHGGSPEMGQGENWMGRILVEVRDERRRRGAANC
jgi:hypothetical protein